MKKIFILAAIAIVATSCKKKCEDQIWYEDADGDGLGNSEVTITGGCDAPDGYVDNSSDKLDATPTQTQRAILPYVGATWCPPCGQYGEETKEGIATDFSTNTAIVISCQSNDAISTTFSTNFGNGFMTHHNATGIPSMFSRGAGTEDKFYPSLSSATTRINTITSMDATVGVVSAAELSGSTVNVTAAVKFFQSSSVEHHVSAYLLENDVEADQQHSTLGTVADMPHDNTLRANASSSYRGESLGTSFSSGQEEEMSFSIPVDASWDNTKLTVVVIVWEGNDLNAVNAHQTAVK